MPLVCGIVSLPDNDGLPLSASHGENQGEWAFVSLSMLAHFCTVLIQFSQPLPATEAKQWSLAVAFRAIFICKGFFLLLSLALAHKLSGIKWHWRFGSPEAKGLLLLQVWVFIYHLFKKK